MIFAQLSPREQQVARLAWVEGLSSKEIGRRIHLSFRTVETHRTHIRQKLGVEGGGGRCCVEMARMMMVHDSRPGNPGDWRSLERAGY